MFAQNPHSQSGVAGILIILLLLAGVAITTAIVQQRTNFLPKADDGSNSTDSGNGSPSGDSGVGDAGVSNSSDSLYGDSGYGESGGGENGSSSGGGANVDAGGGSSGGGSSGGGGSDNDVANDGQSFSNQTEQTQRSFEAAFGGNAASAWANEHNTQVSFESAVGNYDNISSSDVGITAGEMANAHGISGVTAAGWAASAVSAHGGSSLEAGGAASQAMTVSGGSATQSMQAAANGAISAGGSQKDALDAAEAAGNSRGVDPGSIQQNLSQISEAHGFAPPAPAAAVAAAAPAEVTDEGAAAPAPVVAPAAPVAEPVAAPVAPAAEAPTAAVAPNQGTTASLPEGANVSIGPNNSGGTGTWSNNGTNVQGYGNVTVDGQAGAPNSVAVTADLSTGAVTVTISNNVNGQAVEYSATGGAQSAISQLSSVANGSQMTTSQVNSLEQSLANQVASGTVTKTEQK